MRFILVTAILLHSTFLIAQQSERNYIYGTLRGHKSFTGYFLFDNTLTQRGQHISFRNPETKKRKMLYAKNFTTFEGDSIFLRTFKTIPAGTGRLAAMIPRIVTGKLELYSAIYRGFYSFSKSDHFYLYNGQENIRLVRRKFKEQMKELLADDVDIVGRIDRGEVSYNDMPTIIHNYNQRQQNKDSK